MEGAPGASQAKLQQHGGGQRGRAFGAGERKSRLALEVGEGALRSVVHGGSPLWVFRKKAKAASASGVSNR